MKKPNIKQDALRIKTFDFAVRIYKLNQYLVKEKKEYIISKQIMKSGTNPGAMIREATSAESGADFIHKLAIAKKETGETQYWLEILFATDHISQKEFDSLYADSVEIFKLLSSSILTKKKNIGMKLILAILMSLSKTLCKHEYPQRCQRRQRSPKIIKNCWRISPQFFMGIVHFRSMFSIDI